jgi:CHAD domain-containing protein
VHRRDLDKAPALRTLALGAFGPEQRPVPGLRLGMTAADTLEVERKYGAGDSDGLPPLASIPGVDRVGAPEEQDLDAVYFDTATLTLASRRITLRWRNGGKNAGWNLKLPVAARERREITEPLGGDPDSVPERLRQLVRVHTRDHELIPVARLKTRRTVLPLCAADGTILAEFSDDRVDARTLLDPPGQAAWREWEVELVHGPGRLLKAADKLLAANGHRPAELPSKLARALGPNYPQDPAPDPRPTWSGPASAVLLSYMLEQVEALKTHEPGDREDAPDAVHQLRVAARRMRSALATFRKLTDAGNAKQLRAELQWLAGIVGRARDAEVMRTRLREMISAEPPELLLGPVAVRIEEHLGAIYRDARTEGLAVLDGGRYFRLLDSLDAFLAEPPLTGMARKEALRTVGRLVVSERRRLQKAVHALGTGPGTAATDAALHEVRKSGKRLRYAAEAAEPLFGKQAIRLAGAAEKIQQTLGDHQDSVVTREMLRTLAGQAPAAGGNGFSYGRLHALEQQRGEQAREGFFRVWQNSPPKRLRWK